MRIKKKIQNLHLRRLSVKIKPPLILLKAKTLNIPILPLTLPIPVLSLSSTLFPSSPCLNIPIPLPFPPSISLSSSPLSSPLSIYFPLHYFPPPFLSPLSSSLCIYFLSFPLSLLFSLDCPPLSSPLSIYFLPVLILPAFLSSPGLFYHFLFHSHFTCFRSVFLHPLPQGNSNSQPFSLPEFPAYSLFLSTCEANCKEVPHIVAHPSESSPSFICYLFFQFTKWRIFPSLLGNS